MARSVGLIWCKATTSAGYLIDKDAPASDLVFWCDAV